MMSLTPTLLDPFEVAGGARPRNRLPSLEDGRPDVLPCYLHGSLMDPTEWFDRASLPMFDFGAPFVVEESNEAPPWTPEPVDRRWRARGWTNDD